MDSPAENLDHHFASRRLAYSNNSKLKANASQSKTGIHQHELHTYSSVMYKVPTPNSSSFTKAFVSASVCTAPPSGVDTFPRIPISQIWVKLIVNNKEQAAKHARNRYYSGMRRNSFDFRSSCVPLTLLSHWRDWTRTWFVSSKSGDQL